MALNCACSDEGHNGRIPPLSGSGYPTDHGETAAIREIKDVSKIAWSRVVFATTLSPCIMCSSALKWLWQLGLRRVVVAESSSFAGTSLLDELDGMTVIRLSNLKAQSMMKTFSTHYPWDWAADIGEIPPGDLTFSQSLETADALEEFSKKLQKEMKPGHQAAVVSSHGILASAEDERPQSGGNETRSAAMIAMGSAGSQVNLRECVLFFRASNHSAVNLDEFGAVSMGACKLFRPAKVVLTASPTDELKLSLENAGSQVLVASVKLWTEQASGKSDASCGKSRAHTHTHQTQGSLSDKIWTYVFTCLVSASSLDQEQLSDHWSKTCNCILQMATLIDVWHSVCDHANLPHPTYQFLPQ